MQSELGSIPLAPGAFTLVRRTFVEKYGYLREDTMVEDLEMSLRIQSENYLIENVIDANVYTRGVKSFKVFKNQRLRWFCGFLLQLKKYKHLFSKEYGNLGVFILPSTLFYVFLTVFLLFYSIVRFGINIYKKINEIILVGLDPLSWLDWNFDIFFLTLDNTTVMPLALLGIAFFFMMYIKKISNEKQRILPSFITFIFTYWLIGSIVWLIAIYYYFTGKKIKWGPRYYNK